MKTILFASALFSFSISSLIISQELNGPTSWETIGNTFSQPNVHLQLGRNFYDWYGSGDVNNDEVIDSKDLTAMNNGVKNDRSDVDGDGNSSTSNDKKVLGDYLNGTINYLPGHWNSLTTEGEKVNWLEKMMAIQDERQYIHPFEPGKWYCRNHIRQMEIDFYGISNIDEFIQKEKDRGEIEYDKTNNARFNLPLQYFSTINTSGVAHSVSGTLVGDNPLDFNDWYFVEYASDDRIHPGDFPMSGEDYANMKKTAYVEDPDFHNKYFAFVENFLNCDLKNNKATVSYYRPDRLLLTNPNDFTIDVVDPADKTLNYKVNLDTSPNATGTPNVTVTGGLEATLSYADGTRVPTNSQYPGIEFNFIRTWTGEATSVGGVTRKDSETQKITVQDKVNPYGVVPANINITKEQVDANEGLSTSITGNMTGVGDNTGLPVNVDVNYQFVSENSDKQVYNAFFTLIDIIGNDTTYSPQTVNVQKAKINMNQLEDILVNAKWQQVLTPEVLESEGFDAIPKVTTANTTSSYTVNYTQSEKSNSEEYSWANRDVTTTFVATLDNGEAADTMKYVAKVRDIEKPSIEGSLSDTTYAKTDSLKPNMKQLESLVSDNVAVDTITYNYQPITKDDSKEIYDLYLTAKDVFGNESTKKVQRATVDLAVGIDDDGSIVNKYELKQNYPNPFNPTTTIEYSVPQTIMSTSPNFVQTEKSALQNVIIKIYDVLGNEIATLVSENKSAGNYSATFNAHNLSSGVYYYHLKTNDFISIKKMLLLK